jgi:hypothetical protein
MGIDGTLSLDSWIACGWWSGFSVIRVGLYKANS